MPSRGFVSPSSAKGASCSSMSGTRAAKRALAVASLCQIDYRCGPHCGTTVAHAMSTNFRVAPQQGFELQDARDLQPKMRMHPQDSSMAVPKAGVCCTRAVVVRLTRRYVPSTICDCRSTTDSLRSRSSQTQSWRTELRLRGSTSRAPEHTTPTRNNTSKSRIRSGSTPYQAAGRAE